MISTVVTVGGGVAIFVIASWLFDVDEVLVCSSVLLFAAVLALAIVCDLVLALYGAA